MAHPIHAEKAMELDRAREYAELLIAHEPISRKALNRLFDPRFSDDLPVEIIDDDALEGNDHFALFHRARFMYDIYDWDPDDGGYKYYLTDHGLDAFNLERREIPPIEEHDDFEYPRHRCDHENKVRNHPQFDGSTVCMDCGARWS